MVPVIPPITLRIHAEPCAIRAALGTFRAGLEDLGLSDTDLGTVELAVAEALNNIAEHAYPDNATGDVNLHSILSGNRLCIVLRDRGHPLPDGRPPTAPCPANDVPLQNLPEGGFGWHLIRDLTQRISYRRVAGENRLELHFRCSAPAPDGQKP